MNNLLKLAQSLGLYRTAVTNRLDRLGIKHFGVDGFLDDYDLARYFKAEKAFRNKKIRRFKNEVDELNLRIEKEKDVINRINSYSSSQP